MFGCLETNSDVNGLSDTIATFIRYGMVVGTFVEWHPIIIRLLQALTPGGNKGLLALKSIGEKAMSNMDKYLGPSASSNAGSESGQAKPHSFVGVMQERHLKDPSTFSRDDVTYHMIPNIVAGADTSSASLNTAIYYLWRNPRVLARLRDELDKWAVAKGRTTVGGLISMTEAQDLPYLQALLKETLRVFPGLGNNLVRVVPEGGLVIAEQFFPAGVWSCYSHMRVVLTGGIQTVVGMNAFVAHANRDIFGLDADEFRPERWLGQSDSITQMDQYFLSVSKLSVVPDSPLWDARSSICLFLTNFVRLVRSWTSKLYWEEHRSSHAEYAYPRTRTAIRFRANGS